MEKLLKRINELAKKAKTVGLTDDELRERDELRAEYLRLFRQGMRNQLESITLVDKNGNTRKLKSNKE